MAALWPSISRLETRDSVLFFPPIFGGGLRVECEKSSLEDTAKLKSLDISTGSFETSAKGFCESSGYIAN